MCVVFAAACLGACSPSAPTSSRQPASVAIASGTEPTAPSSEAGTTSGEASPTPGPSTDGSTPRLDAEPTRILIETLGIDLPVIRPPEDETFPFCDVAEFLPAYGLPGLPGVTYLYAHARAGMFLPLLETSRRANGAGMLGRETQLFSSDGFRRRYVITEVHRHVHDLDVVNRLSGDALVLQTSETSHSTGAKLVVVARPKGIATPVSMPSARPVARPRACGD